MGGERYMLSVLKGFFGNEGQRDLVELSDRLEEQANEPPHGGEFGNVVDTARDLRDALVCATEEIKRSEKIRLLKLLNKAKVRALLRGDTEGYRIFSALDSIGSDLLRAF